FMIKVPKMLVLCRQTAFSLYFWVNWRGASTLSTCLQDLMQQNGIGYVLNASNTCPKPDFIPESHFLRVPVNDSFCEKILPWLDKSVDFIEKAKASNGCVLIHCLAGISRSATIAIAYIMKRMDMSLDEAYRRQKPTDRADSRRSWHEESPFEKQFKRRSCQMEFGESIMSENRSREELGKVGSQSSFSGSMEIIEVS
ncbi:dual specificity phosphatase 16, isoform CRA_a, partial [Mus musculus]